MPDRLISIAVGELERLRKWCKERAAYLDRAGSLLPDSKAKWEMELEQYHRRLEVLRVQEEIDARLAELKEGEGKDA